MDAEALLGFHPRAVRATFLRLYEIKKVWVI